MDSKLDRFDMFIADLLYGMSNRPRGTYSKDEWSHIKILSLELSKENGFA